MAEQKGDALVADAEKKLKSWSLFGSGGKTEAAAEMYKSAAGQYIRAKEWDKAGETYIKEAELQEKMGQSFDALSCYTNAAKAFKNTSVKEAVKCYKIAVELHCEANRFSSAAKLYKEIAIMEEKDYNYKGALRAYAEAADMFLNDDAVASASPMLLKVAELATRDGDYTRAIEEYEKVIEKSLENTLLAHSCKDYMFKAALCQFVVAAKKDDINSAIRLLDRYKGMHPSFESDRGCVLLDACVQAFENDDLTSFQEALFKYNRISPLNASLTTQFTEIKNALQPQALKAEAPIDLNAGNPAAEDESWQNDTKTDDNEDDFLK